MWRGSLDSCSETLKKGRLLLSKANKMKFVEFYFLVILTAVLAFPAHGIEHIEGILVRIDCEKISNPSGLCSCLEESLKNDVASANRRAADAAATLKARSAKDFGSDTQRYYSSLAEDANQGHSQVESDLWYFRTALGRGPTECEESCGSEGQKQEDRLATAQKRQSLVKRMAKAQKRCKKMREHVVERLNGYSSTFRQARENFEQQASFLHRASSTDSSTSKKSPIGKVR
jgi:hypothetical protein